MELPFGSSRISWHQTCFGLAIFVALNGLTAASATNMQVDDHSYILNEPISPATQAQVRTVRRSIKYVYVEPGFEGQIFEDRSLFPNVQRVTLRTNSTTNEQLLKALASTFPRLKHLSIAQKVPLSIKSIQLLKAFSNLEFLGIECEVVSPSLLNECVPGSISHMLLTGKDSATYKLPSLPNLVYLRIEGVTTDEFMHSLQAPKLEELNIDGTLSHEAVKEIGRFKLLKFLFIKEPLLKDDYDHLNRLGIKQVVCKQQ